MKARRLFVSFSGGETSALMTWAILNRGFLDNYDDVRVVFANTGQESADDAATFSDFDPRLDLAGGCGESCEVFADEGDSNA